MVPTKMYIVGIFIFALITNKNNYLPYLLMLLFYEKSYFVAGIGTLI